MTSRARIFLWGAICLFGCVAFAAALARAQAVSPEAKGEAVARRLCAGCHSITSAGKSRHDLAPPFRDLPKRYPVANLAEALAEGIVVSHKDMPQFTLDPPEIDAILSFMNSLVPEAQRAMK